MTAFLAAVGFLGELAIALLGIYCIGSSVFAFRSGFVHVYGEQAPARSEPMAFSIIVGSRFLVAGFVGLYFWREYFQ